MATRKKKTEKETTKKVVDYQKSLELEKKLLEKMKEDFATKTQQSDAEISLLQEKLLKANRLLREASNFIPGRGPVTKEIKEKIDLFLKGE